MTLTAGTRLGSYEVVAPLAAGGMGEVYRARDPKSGRDVAIKVLPALFAGDADRVARFEREAHALAGVVAPQHPLDSRFRRRGGHGTRRNGAARGRDAARPAAVGPAEMTERSVILGTVGYMAPE